MKDKKELDQFDIDWWIKHRDRSLSNKWYAIGRIDLLIISISGGGIYIAFEIVKFIKSKTEVVDIELLKYSGLFFAVAIITNFISQVFGFYSNKHEAIWAKYKIYEAKNKKFNKELMGAADCKVKIYNWGVLITNNISVFLMIAGIILLAAFNFIKL